MHQALGGAGRLFRILGHTARHCPAALPLARATTQQPRHFVALLRYCAPSLMQARAASGAAGSAGDALDASDWAKLGAYLKDYDDKRETLIKRTREIQKLSKQAIFSLHRGDAQRAAAQLRDAEAISHELLPLIQTHPALRQGSFSAAMEEYAEAVIFKEFLQHGRLVTAAEVPLADPEEYLGGVLDFTGELNRYAIARATVRDVAAVAACASLVESIMGGFLQFDLRNSSLRKKYDALKYTLQKMHNTLYELSLVEASGGLKRRRDEGPDEEAAARQDTAPTDA